MQERKDEKEIPEMSRSKVVVPISPAENPSLQAEIQDIMSRLPQTSSPQKKKATSLQKSPTPKLPKLADDRQKNKGEKDEEKEPEIPELLFSDDEEARREVQLKIRKKSSTERPRASSRGKSRHTRQQFLRGPRKPPPPLPASSQVSAASIASPPLVQSVTDPKPEVERHKEKQLSPEKATLLITLPTTNAQPKSSESTFEQQPIIGLQDEQKRAPQSLEISLSFTFARPLGPELYIMLDLSNCENRATLQHELEHVDENGKEGFGNNFVSFTSPFLRIKVHHTAPHRLLVPKTGSGYGCFDSFRIILTILNKYGYSASIDAHAFMGIPNTREQPLTKWCDIAFLHNESLGQVHDLIECLANNNGRINPLNFRKFGETAFQEVKYLPISGGPPGALVHIESILQENLEIITPRLVTPLPLIELDKKEEPKEKPVSTSPISSAKEPIPAQKDINKPHGKKYLIAGSIFLLLALVVGTLIAIAALGGWPALAVFIGKFKAVTILLFSTLAALGSASLFWGCYLNLNSPAMKPVQENIFAREEKRLQQSLKGSKALSLEDELTTRLRIAALQKFQQAAEKEGEKKAVIAKKPTIEIVLVEIAQNISGPNHRALENQWQESLRGNSSFVEKIRQHIIEKYGIGSSPQKLIIDNLTDANKILNHPRNPSFFSRWTNTTTWKNTENLVQRFFNPVGPVVSQKERGADVIDPPAFSTTSNGST